MWVKNWGFLGTLTQAPYLNERDYGRLSGMNKQEAANQYGSAQVHTWRRSFRQAPPGGESLEDTAHRVIPYFLSSIKPKLLEGGHVLVVAHGNSLRALVMHLEKMSETAVVALNIETCKPITYTLEKGGSFKRIGL